MVDEVHAALKHFFKEEGGAFGLRGEDNGNTHQVGWEGGPNAVFNFRGIVPNITLDGSTDLLG